MIRISLAKISDTKVIMNFMNDVWRAGHILSKHKKLFLHEFQDGNNLNFIIAKDRGDNLVGIFGFIKYNSSENPDIAGSLWKVDPKVKEPLLGLKMREYFRKHVKHRFFAAPGAGLQTKPIYKMIKMNWNRMEQYYIVNDRVNQFYIAKNPKIKQINKKINEKVQVYKMNNIADLEMFDFNRNENVVPRKDISYFEKRFIDYPIYKYDIFCVKIANNIENIFVCRESRCNGEVAYRIVDFYGDLCYINEIANFLHKYVVENNFEYVDFVEYGFEKEKLEGAGFMALDFDNDDTIIPNFFEPYVQQNVPVYCVSDRTELTFRQCKADGDQDRPNYY